jgi:hypothetical protein
LVVVFVAFVVTIAYLVAASMTRRSAPAYPVSPANRTRAANWEQVGDTLTVDASDGERWTYVSLARGRVLTPPDTAGWDLAVQRYRIKAHNVVSDLGPRPFERAGGQVTPSVMRPPNTPFDHWYHYNMLTHLLEPKRNLYLTMSGEGRVWKLAILSYYCPGLVAGCLTIRYAPVP